MIGVSYLVRAALGLAVILALLGWMTLSNERARSSGDEVILQTYPIDPRDVFFGHYATLRYRDFVPRDVQLAWPVEQGMEEGESVFVTLTASGAFHKAGASFATLDEALAEGLPVLRAELVAPYLREDESIEFYYARFDLPHQYFADPDTAMALQDAFQTASTMQRQRDAWEECTALSQTSPEEFAQSWRCEDINLDDEPTADIPRYGAILSVSDTGEAVIKGLYLDGERVIDSLTGSRLVLERSED